MALVVLVMLSKQGIAQATDAPSTPSASAEENVRPPQEKASASKEKITAAWKAAGWKLPRGWKPVTDAAAAEAWGLSIDAATLNGDVEALTKLIDFNQAYLKAVSVSKDANLKRAFVAGGKAGSANLLKTFCDPDGSYLFRRVESTEFGPCALVRLTTAQGACDYQRWMLLENDQGNLVGVDFHSYIAGETLSESIERIFLLAIPHDDRNFIQKLFDQKNWGQDDGQQLVNLFQAVQKGDNQKVIGIYRAMSAKMKDEKFVLLATASAVSELDETMYVRLLEKFRKKYPGEVAADIASIDVHFMKNDFDQMFKTIDRVEDFVGPDAHLQLLRAGGYITTGKTEKVMEILQKAIEIEPYYESPYWSLVELAVKEKKFGLVTQTLKALVTLYGYNEFAFEGEELYAPYLTTPEFKEFEAFLQQFNRGEN